MDRERIVCMCVREIDKQKEGERRERARAIQRKRERHKEKKNYINFPFHHLTDVRRHNRKIQSLETGIMAGAPCPKVNLFCDIKKCLQNKYLKKANTNFLWAKIHLTF